MTPTHIEASIEIDAPASTVWGMFTNPAFTGQMGGEYVSDWKVGSALQWRSSSGQILTNGMILEIEQEKLLKHTLFASPESSSVMATLTYELNEKDGCTCVQIREDFTNPITEQELLDSKEGWNAALSGAKEIAEKLASK
jgi:uncharacterized protein YndB with AHSA1/START domain